MGWKPDLLDGDSWLKNKIMKKKEVKFWNDSIQEIAKLRKPLLSVVLSEEEIESIYQKERKKYEGSSWEVECEKCDENVRDLYSNDDALLIVENMLTENKNSRNEKTNRKIKWK